MHHLVHHFVLCYHAISQTWPAALAVSPYMFRQQLETLLRRGYSGVTFTDMVNGEGPPRAFAVTFDDAYRSVMRNARPVLDDLGVPATVFAPTSMVGKPGPMVWDGIDQWLGTPYEQELTCMSWAELRELRGAGWEVASHTKSHPRLTELEDDELGTELVESREVCERELGLSSVTLAYPYGIHDARVRSAARDAGYAAAAADRPGPVKQFQWPRINLHPVDDPWRFRVKVSPAVRVLRDSPPGVVLDRLRCRYRKFRAE
jgi:peptidoglycan/xylan/chitin deacetylase (PgdA/CDA1 family)